MTKWYDIISIDGYLYMVDRKKDTVFQVGEMLITGFDKNTLYQVKTNDNIALINPYSILATNNPNIPDLPRLPEVDDSIILTASVNSYLGDTMRRRDYVEGYVAGYKAATKKYTEEDIMLALIMMADEVRKNGFGGLSTANSVAKRFWVDKVSKRLNKIPIAVEAEVEYIDPYSYDSINRYEVKPKLQNNTVIIKNWIYE